jgi:deazaflavin-dependent oxidoreductase (nitroreductase family)
MTAATRPEAAPRTLPRPLIRLFWALHRAAYRVSGGRFGLTRPAPGKAYGMLRLETVGRRSGKARAAMIGYFPDGANLVTIAMNGWADRDPAWWRNLQASSEATVVLPEGPRRVRAHAASGAERDRLWARVAEFPGWGADITALAARRPDQTAVVILEPVSEGVPS